MNKIRAVIIDDEEDSIKVLKILLEKYCRDKVEIVATYTSATIALLDIKELDDFDLLFLDIQLENEMTSGFDVIRSIEKKNYAVIFITAYPEFGAEAWGYTPTAVAYLTKPVKPIELIKALDKAAKALDKAVSSTIFETQKNGIKILDEFGSELTIKLEDIICIEADDNNSIVITKDGERHKKNKSLLELEKWLEGTILVRVHKSWIININRIKAINKSDKYLIMEKSVGDKYNKINIGEAYFTKLINRLPNTI